MLEVTNLQVAYGEIQVVWDLSLIVPQGSIVALLGPNGAGKTTALRAIMGLLPVLDGNISFRGEPVIGRLTHEIVQSGLVMIPEARATFSTLSVLDNLELGAFTRRARPYRDATLKQLFEIFPRLAERRNQLVGTLSGGERQMVAIGKALMARPDLLLLDEPSLGLAPLMVERMFDVIKQINQSGVSILLVEQNVQLALELAAYGYIMELGRIALEGQARELLHNARIQEAYLSF
jgi:branched-chain amino acid transport system ATP-binding protein